jgi:hypothetical protein
MSEARQFSPGDQQAALDSDLLQDIEKALADPLYASRPDLVEAMRQRLAFARGEVPDAETEIQRFNEAMFVVRRESAPGGLYHDRPWLAEEAEQRARVILARAGVPEPKPETPQERALREIDEEMPPRGIAPGLLAALDEELRVSIEVPLGAGNLQDEMHAALSRPNQSLDQIMANLRALPVARRRQGGSERCVHQGACRRAPRRDRRGRLRRANLRGETPSRLS